MDKIILLPVILVLIITDLFISSIAVVKYGAYEISWIHRWGFNNFGMSYVLLGALLSFVLTFLVTEFAGKLMEKFAPKQAEAYFFAVYFTLIVSYFFVIIYNLLILYWIKT